MNGEIERAFVEAVAPIFPGVQILKGLSAVEAINEIPWLTVDGSGENESPVSRLWRLPINFKFSYPAMIEEVDQEAAILAASDTLEDWLRDRAGVLAAFVSPRVKLLDKYHLSAIRHGTEDMRLTAEITITAGFLRL